MDSNSLQRGPEEGAVVVEAAITLALLTALIFGIVTFGIALWQGNTMLLAIEEAGRYVMIHNGCDTNCAENQMKSVLTSYAALLPNQNWTCTVANPNPLTLTAPTVGNICVYASITPAPNPQTNPPTPATMTLTAMYAYNNVIVPTGLLAALLPGAPFTLTNQGTFPLD